MSSRFGTYLESMKLAKMHWLGAQEYDKKGQQDNVNHNLIRAVEYLIVANYNLASIAFNKKPKGGK